MRRLKPKDLVKARTVLLEQQGYRCPLCRGTMRGAAKKRPALDHDHKTGYIRDVLCVNCNGIEGKVFNLARRAKASLDEHEWLENLVAYLQRHRTPRHGGVFHPTHKTDAEKRAKINAKARAKRAALKANK